MRNLFSEIQVDIVEYVFEECKRQGCGIDGASDMLRAWDHAIGMENVGAKIDKVLISVLQCLVVGSVTNDFRHCNVRFANGNVVGWENIPRQINSLLESQDTLTPQEFYEEFEKVHPFIDGNGRVGKILFNYKNGTLLDPVWPKEPEWM